MKPMMGLAIWSTAVLSAAGVWAQALPTAEPSAVGMSSERLDRIEATFEAEVERGELPGAVIMVARDGQLVYSAAVGELAPEADTDMVDDAIFRIYSMTKPLTSVAALILMEEGKLQLADPVHKFLPEFEGLEVSAGDDAGQGAEPTDRPMTVQDLLRHTSGLAYGELTQNEAVKAAYAEAGSFNPDGMAFDARALSGDEQVAALGRAPLARQPGSQWEYSLSTDVLGRVVERVSGQRLGDFLEERVFGPLQMQDSGFHVPENAATRLAEPFAIDPESGEPLPMIDVSQRPANDSGGAGAVSSAGDYLRFAQMLANGGELDGARILSPSTVRLMASDHLGEIDPGAGPGQLLLGSAGYTFGLGVMVREQDGIASVPGAEGQFMWAGYGGTYFWVDPEYNLVTVLMSQRAGPSRVYYRRHVMQLVYQAITDEVPTEAQETALQ